MPVKILEREYTSIFRPQDTNINWLIGNIGVWQKLRLRCEFEVAINFDTSSTLFMEEPNIFTLNDGSTWQDNGFEVGDSFEVKWATTKTDDGTTTVSTVTGVINEIDGATMQSSNTTLGGGALISNIYPVQFSDKKIHSVFIRANKQPKGINFKYAHLTNFNLDSLNFSSFIDGTITAFEANNTDTLSIGQSIPMTFKGNQSGMSVASCNLIYIAPQNTKYIYDIEIVFMISAFFNDITNLEDNTPPTEMLDAECVTDLFEVVGLPTYNNPNITIKTDQNQYKKQGNTGWFDENFNGLENGFEVTSLTYTNFNGTQVNQLDYRNPIKVEAVIDMGTTVVTGQTKCAYGFQWVPTEESDYKTKPTGFYQNTKMNTGGTATQFSDVFTVSNSIDNTFRLGYSSDNARMNVQNVRFRQTGANEITFEAEFKPNGDFATFFDAKDATERNYVLWVSVADQNLTTNNSNRVSLKLDFNQMDTFIEPLGAFDTMTIGFLNHTQDNTDTPVSCGNDIKIEDDLTAKIEFQVDTTVDPTIPIPTGLEYGILIERDSDGFQYKLDSYSIDLTQFPNPTQYNFNASRGFKLGANNPKNVVSVNYYPPLDSGSLVGVQGLYGFKIRWEDWIARNNVPTDITNAFYDSSLKSNGISNDWYRYLLVSGWTLQFYVFTNALLDGNEVRYENKKPLVFDDYDQNSGITTTFTYKRESDGAVLTAGIDPESGLPLGVILANELVRLEIEYVRSVGTWASVNDVYAINTIEVREGAGQKEYRQLSSIWLPEPDNPLLPLTGATLLDLQLINPTTIRATCLIDPFRLIDSQNYKITGREGCK